MSPGEVEELRVFCRRQLARWRDHPDWEDMVQEAWVRLWQRTSKDGVSIPEAWKGATVKTAALGWLASPRAHRAVVRLKDGRTVSFVSLESPATEDGAARLDGIAAPDLFAPLLDRLEARALWENLMALTNERQRRILTALYRDGARVTDVAAAEGCSLSALVEVRERALNRLRRSLSVPQYHDAGAQGPPNAEKRCCPQGHPYAGDNLIATANGRRHCRICANARSRQYREKRKQASAKNKKKESPGTEYQPKDDPAYLSSMTDNGASPFSLALAPEAGG